MKLYTLMFGRSKAKKRAIMTDSFEKCQNYQNARSNVKGWHEIVLAEENACVWKQKTATIGGNKEKGVLRVGEGRSGWIGKNGFNEHT